MLSSSKKLSVCFLPGTEALMVQGITLIHITSLEIAYLGPLKVLTWIYVHVRMSLLLDYLYFVVLMKR